METKLYLQLSAVMFLEYAIWGAWMPVLAARLLGPLKMSGKQTGWIYATLPLACIIAPLIAGYLADKYWNAEWILAIAHLIGAVLIFYAARITKFKTLFIVMLLYSVFFAGTLPLVNSFMFYHLGKVFSDEAKVDAASAKIFIWAPVAWALIGYFLTGWRWKFKSGEQGRDCLYLAAFLSLVMGVSCLFMPSTPPSKLGNPIFEAMKMLGESNFLIFIILSMVVAGLMQFYFLGTAQFMQDLGIPNKNVPASMAIAQACQALATLFALGLFVDKFGYKWTLVIGAACWMVLYFVYIIKEPRWLVITSQSLHGLAYVFFIIVGQIYVKSVASKEILSSMQAIIFAVTTGIGLFLGTQFAGIVMDYFRKEEKFQWRSVFLVPCGIMAACVIAFMLFFKG